MNFTTMKTQTPKQRPDPSKLGFGQYFTDHMFLMDGEVGKGWYDGRIVPYGPLSLDPAAMVLHYGQEIFEGLKAYRAPDGVQLFRPEDNIRRFNHSCLRLSIPEVDEAVFMDALRQLILTDLDWVPEAPDASLYIRPYMIAVDAHVGVRRSNHYLFVIILSPVGPYYPGGITPTKILIEDEDVRSVVGALGAVKAGANYAATLRAQTRAQEKGFTQVMWLDAIHRKYIEEVGTSNAFFVIDGKVVTPALSGSILPGITRDSCLSLLKKWGIPVEERPVLLDEIFAAHENGTLSECFATGTAAVISPVGELYYKDRAAEISEKAVGPIAKRLYDTLTGIQWGRIADDNGWIVPLK